VLRPHALRRPRPSVAPPARQKRISGGGGDLGFFSFWMTTGGAVLVMLSLFLGEFSTTGWLALSSLGNQDPGVGLDYYIWALQVAGVGTTLSGINLLVTIIKMRAPGMNLMKMPVFTWTALCTNALIVATFPILTAALALMTMDRYLGTHFFTNDLGGNAMLYVNLIWIWGHPEVYILILPCFGIYSEIVATFCRKRLFGYTSMVYATVCITIGIWGYGKHLLWYYHHDYLDSYRGQDIQLAIYHVPRAHSVFRAHAVDYRFYVHLRHRRHDGRAAGRTTGRFCTAQLPILDCPFSQRDYWRCGLCRFCRDTLLVS